MSKAVWKFPLEVGRTDVPLPEGSQLLDVQVQHDRLCLWALVDPARAKEVRSFVVAGTGHEHADENWDGLEYVATFQLDGGSFVGHVFEHHPPRSRVTGA